MKKWIRRHSRWLAGILALGLVVAGVAHALHSAGSAHAQPARGVRQVHAIAPPVLAPTSQRRFAAAAAHATSAARRPAVAPATRTGRRGRARAGLPTSAPSTRSLSRSL